MDHWAAIVPAVQEWLNQRAVLVSGLNPELALALLLVPIALAAISRNIVLGLGCITMVLAAGLALLVPAQATVVFGSTLYIGSIIVSSSAIIARRRSKKSQDEFAMLHSQVNQLLAAESGRMLRDIRSGSKAQAPEDTAD